MLLMNSAPLNIMHVRRDDMNKKKKKIVTVKEMSMSLFCEYLLSYYVLADTVSLNKR